MPLTPKARSLVLYEGSGEGTPFGEMSIPEAIATLSNTFGTSQRPLNQVEGGVEKFDALDELLQKLGV